jgi:NTP pyrophosphatase (non-canonical NTP hydrolase)
MYYLYHIPGKKIGVTRNLNNRVTEQQGYSPDEYEVLFTSNDIDEVSFMEIELQKSYGYKVDRQSYKNLINKNNQMKVNVTAQTTTFPVPLNKLKENLMDNKGMDLSNSFKSIILDEDITEFITKNARTSMFNDNRCFVYNKALANFAEDLANDWSVPKTIMLDKKKKKKKKKKNNKQSVFELIRSWASDKGIYKSGDSKTQYIKLMEEAGELAQALLKNDENEVIDAIGDMVVVLTNLAKLRGYDIEDCVWEAYEVIKSRQGKMINGTFVKETL